MAKKNPPRKASKRRVRKPRTRKPTDVPISGLLKKFDTNPDSLSLNERETIERYKKIVGAGAAGAKKPAPKKKSGGRKKKLSLEQRIEIQRQRDLDAIDAKLDSGVPLTASDRKMQADMLEGLAAVRSRAEVDAAVRHAIEKGLGPEKVSSIHELIRLRDTSSRDDVRASCACKIISLAQAEAEPDEEFEIEDFDPSEPPRSRTVLTEHIAKKIGLAKSV